MTTSITWARKVTRTAGKIVLVLAVASAVGGLSTGPALGEDNDRRQQQQYRDRHDNRDRRDNRNRYDNRDRRYYQQPVYAPPPVVYTPYPSPGISLFFPFFR